MPEGLTSVHRGATGGKHRSYSANDVELKGAPEMLDWAVVERIATRAIKVGGQQRVPLDVINGWRLGKEGFWEGTM